VSTHVNSYLTVVDVEVLEYPDPIPPNDNSGRCIVDSDVTEGKLLVSDPHTELASIEDKIGQEAS
jgi:hypothetical protein